MNTGGGDVDRVLKISAGFLLGAVVGVGVVLLLAPHSGEETREMIRERIDAILEEGRLAAEERRQELSAQFESLKQPLPRA
jgi:gas vesicle protein